MVAHCRPGVTSEWPTWDPCSSLTRRERDTLELEGRGQLSETAWTEEGSGPREQTGEVWLEGKGSGCQVGDAQRVLTSGCATRPGASGTAPLDLSARPPDALWIFSAHGAVSTPPVGAHRAPAPGCLARGGHVAPSGVSLPRLDTAFQAQGSDGTVLRPQKRFWEKSSPGVTSPQPWVLFASPGVRGGAGGHCPGGGVHDGQHIRCRDGG